MNINYKKLLGVEPNKELFEYEWVGNEKKKPKEKGDD